MKVYVDELPKICKDCNCLNRVNGRCQLLHLYVDEDEKQEDCPLESIADHDKKVRAEVVAENQSLKERWEKLKEYIEKSIEADNKYLKSFPNNMNFENYRTAKRVILETMKELEK